MSTKVILEYHRGADEWQCPICDAENSMSHGSCSVCGGTRSADAIILKRWTPTPVAKKTETRKMDRSVYDSGRVFKDRDGGGYAVHDDSSNSGCITALMIILVILILALAIFLISISSQAAGPENSFGCFYDCPDLRQGFELLRRYGDVL